MAHQVPEYRLNDVEFPMITSRENFKDIQQAERAAFDLNNPEMQGMVRVSIKNPRGYGNSFYYALYNDYFNVFIIVLKILY